MHGHAPRDPDAHRAHLAVRRTAVRSGRRVAHPDAAAPLDPAAGDADLVAGPDERLLDQPYVGDDVDGVAELDDRVSHELTRAMPGDLAAPVDVDHGCARVGERTVEWAGALARGVDRLVLKQQYGVGHLVGHPPRVRTPLQLPPV